MRNGPILSSVNFKGVLSKTTIVPLPIQLIPSLFPNSEKKVGDQE